MEVENGPRGETKVIFHAPIFHFHDYGGKGSNIPTIHIQGRFVSFREGIRIGI